MKKSAFFGTIAAATFAAGFAAAGTPSRFRSC